MADRAFSTLTARAAPSAPGCPTETIRRYIRDAAINVCERSLAWRYEIPKYELLPGVHKYTFNVPANTEVCCIFAAIVNDQPLDLLNLDAALQQYPKWADLYSGEDPDVLWSLTPSASINSYVYNEQTFDGITDFVLPDAVVAEASTPRAVTQITPDQYVILPLPDGEKEYFMRMFVALKPRRDATGMEQNIFNDLEDAILHRALNNLLILPNVPWSDRDAATYHAKQYHYYTHERKARANLGNNRGSMSVRMRPFA